MNSTYSKSFWRKISSISWKFDNIEKIEWSVSIRCLLALHNLLLWWSLSFLLMMTYGILLFIFLFPPTLHSVLPKWVSRFNICLFKSTDIVIILWHTINPQKEILENYERYHFPPQRGCLSSWHELQYPVQRRTMTTCMTNRPKNRSMITQKSII